MTTELEQVPVAEEALLEQPPEPEPSEPEPPEIDDAGGGDPPAEDVGDGEDDEDEDIGLYSYVITYQNGIPRQVFTDESIDEVNQRLSTALGKRKPMLVRFPPNGELTREDVGYIAGRLAHHVSEAGSEAMSEIAARGNTSYPQ